MPAIHGPSKMVAYLVFGRPSDVPVAPLLPVSRFGMSPALYQSTSICTVVTFLSLLRYPDALVSDLFVSCPPPDQSHGEMFHAPRPLSAKSETPEPLSLSAMVDSWAKVVGGAVWPALSSASWLVISTRVLVSSGTP